MLGEKWVEKPTFFYLMNNIEKIIRNSLPKGIFLIELKFKKKSGYLKIIVDGSRPVTINDTTRITKKVKNIEEINSLFHGGYRLEVTTPGIDSGLEFAFQYKKFLHKQLEIKLKNEEIKKQLNGELVNVDDHGIKINANDGLFSFKFSEILSAKPKIEF